MNSKRHLPSAHRALATAALAAFALANPSAHAAPVWNVNIGDEITTSDNFIGAAPENTLNSFWNSVMIANPSAMALKDSTNTASTATLTLTGPQTHTGGGWATVTGPEIFSQWIKDPANATPFSMTIGGLAAGTYDLVIYSDWYWKGGDDFPVTQTAGTGLAGTIYLNNISTGTNGVVPGLVQDTAFGLNDATEGNWMRITGLTPDGSGNLGFSMGGTNAAFNGFQLVKMSGGAPDTNPPSPSPMTWLNVPAAVGSSSITMTATTASDASPVQYKFTETTNNPGATSSEWQNSSIYTDTGLDPNTLYTYTVQARDVPANNETTASAPASATTGMASPSAVVWNVNMGSELTPSDNFVGAATENTQNSIWNSLTSVPQTAMVLQDSTGSSAAGVTLDITGDNVRGQNLNSGAELFYSWIGGLGHTANMTLRGLSITHSYDLIIYSDWWWKNGDSYPVSQTIGTGMTGTIYVNRIQTGDYGTVPPLTEDTNPANVATGVGNVGNWYRITGLVPEFNGQLGFLLGDGNNAPINGFQLIRTGVLPPRADMVTFGLPGNPAVISGTNITLTVPYATSVTSLSPTFTLAPGATCVPLSGTTRNFTSPQTYTVTSSDSLITKIYNVTVVIAPPLPVFTLTAPATWDGRQTITVQPNITNLALLQATGGTNFNYQWSVSGLAVIQQITPGVLTLTRSQGSGPMVVTLILDNGGFGVTESVTINVQEPATDPWVERTPGATEQPVTGQFFARNPDTGFGTIYYNGTQGGTPDSVYLKVYKTPSGGSETLDATYSQSLVGGGYAFSAPIAAGLITYRVVFGTTTGGIDTDAATVTDLVCGDAYIIEGQSNAYATDNSAPRDDSTSPWIRTYATDGAWSYARSKATDPLWPTNIGFWGKDLAMEIVANHQMPVCIINGAVGGTRIDEHQANPAGHTVAGTSYSIYANLLNRVIGANLTHGIRGVFWHQGESDCSNFGPISDYDYTTYQQLFLNMSSAWKQDYPNIQRYIIYQVMPKPCSIGPKGDQLREVQRNLPRLYSKMNILNTLGLAGYEGCHFSAAGYTNMANRMAPLVSQDFYGVVPGASVTAPNLKRAYFTTSARTAIALEFDQAMNWSSFSLPNYYVDKVGDKVTSGSVSGNVVTLQLSSAAAATATLDYLEDNSWNPGESVSSLLYGANAIPALTFADVPIGTLSPYEIWAGGSFANAFTDTAATGDPDGDGQSNQEEFAFGLDPTSGSSVNPITQQLAGGVFKYTRTKDSGLNYKVSYSTNLSGWTWDEFATQSPAAAVGGVETVTVTLALTTPPVGGKLFVRVEATPTL